MKKRLLETALLLVLVTVSPAPAEEGPECPPPPRVKRGLQVRTALGVSGWTGSIGSNSRPGLGFLFSTGYELFSFLAMEASWTSALHDADQPYPPAPGGFSVYSLQGGVRLSLPLEPLDVFLRGGVGWTWMEPDVLVRVEKLPLEPTFGWHAGAGLFWHTPLRGFFVGAEAACHGFPSLSDLWLVGGLVLGVTLP